MRVLLVDHDSESLEAITRAIRGVLELDCVTSKGDALLLLRQNQYDVLIACERAVDGSGLDLLGRTTRTAAPLKRIFAAAPERLQLLGPRLAPFKVQRTINYPIDLEELWLAIAQVTGGPNEETDGTIERVVLDERGIPSAGTVPRSPIPPRPPAPLAAVPPPPPAPAPAVSSAAASGRYATARAAQPAPEPPLRPPPPPRQPPQVRAPTPPAPTDTGRMRALAPAPATSDTGRMRALAPPVPAMPPMRAAPAPLAPPPREMPAWTPEPLGMGNDEFTQLAAQMKLGVQQSAVDEAARRKRQRLFMACGAAVIVAGAIVFAIEKLYDPEARARAAAIAQSKQEMVEQQKVTDGLMLIEIDIENAIMNNDLDTARTELAKLVEQRPDHPRREFLQASIDRAAALAKLQPQSAAPAAAEPRVPAQAAVLPANTAHTAPPRKPADHTAERSTPAPERAAPARVAREGSQNSARAYGAPIGEAPREPMIPLDAPINAAPTTSVRRSDNAFVGRTLEASDASVTRAPAAAPTSSVGQATSPAPSGSNAVAIPPAAASAPAAAAPAVSSAPPSGVEVVPAKIVKRVAPIAPVGISRKTAGYVVVKFNITDGGRVADVEVVESSPAGVFDEAAENAVRKWMYEPRKENGVAVASQAKARLVFDPAN
jgi:TonB family protein